MRLAKLSSCQLLLLWPPLPLVAAQLLLLVLFAVDRACGCR